MVNETWLWKFRNLTEESVSLEKHLVQFVQAVFDLYRSLRTILFISYTGNLLDKMHLTNVEIYTGEHIHEHSYQELIMIIVETLEDLEKYMRSMYNKYGFHSSDKHFIIYLGYFQVGNVFEVLWRYFLTNVVVVDRFNDVYTYRPIIDGCSAIKPTFLFNTEHSNLSVIFDYKLDHFHGCEIRAMAIKYPPYVIDVQAVDNPGTEITLLRAAAVVLNFTLSFVQHNNTFIGERLGDNRFTGGLKDLYENKTDILCGMFIGEPLMREMVFAPGARMIPAWKIVTVMFEPTSWACLLSILIVLNIFIHFSKKIIAEKIDVLQPLGVMLNQAIKQPKSMTFKMIFLHWTFFSHIITSIYITILIMFLTTPIYEKEVQTFDEIKSNNWVLGLKRQLEKYVYLSDLNFSHIIECPMDIVCLNRTAVNKDMFVIDSKDVGTHYAKHLTNDMGQLNLFQTNWKILYFYLRYVIRKGHPIKNMLDNVKSRFSENGLVIVWRSRVSTVSKITGKYDSAKPIDLDYFTLNYLIFFAGISIATIIFIFELKS